MELAKETSISGVLDVQHGIVVPPGVLQTLLPEVSSIVKNAVAASSEEKQNQNNLLNQPSSDLLRHVILFCKVCDKPCANRSVLNRHMNLHYTEDNVKQFYCKSCKLRQTCLIEVVHMKSYVAYFANCYSCMKPLSMFICEQCGKCFLFLEDVIRHIEKVTTCKVKNKFSSISHKQSRRGTAKKLKSYSNRNYLKHSVDLHTVEIDVRLTYKQNYEILFDIKKRAAEKDLNEYLTKKSEHICVLDKTDTKMTEDTKEISELTNIEHGTVNIKEEPSNVDFLDTAKKKQEEILDKYLSKKTDHRELAYETDTKFSEDAEEPSESINSEHGIVAIKEEPSTVEFLNAAKKKQEEDLDKYLSKKTDHRELAYETDTKFSEDAEEPSESINSEHGIVAIKEEPSTVEFLNAAKKKQEEDLDKYLSKKTDHRELAYDTDTKFTEDAEEPSESINSEHGIVNIKEEPSNVEFLDTQKKDLEELLDKYLTKNTKHRELEVERDTKTDEDAKKLSELVYMEPDIINLKEESSDVEFVSEEETTSAEEKEFGINPGKLSDIEFVSSGVTSSTVVKEFSKNPSKRKCYKLLCLTRQPKVSTVFKDASTAGSNSSKEKQIHKTILNAFACRNCAMYFSTQQELHAHIDKHGYTCKECNKPFDSNNDLLRHFCLFCKQCEKLYNTKAKFLVHTKKHAVIKKKTLVSTLSKNDSVIKCNLIENNYFKRQNYWCDTCKEGFDDDFSLTSHKRFHGGPAKSYAVRKAPKLYDVTPDGKTKLPGEVKVDVESSDFEFIKPETCTYKRNFSGNNIPTKRKIKEEPLELDK